MALQASGQISLADVNVEFSRASTTPVSMSQLYRGGGIVTTNNANVPTSGAISLSNFYSATRQFTYTISANQTNLNLRTGAIAAGWDQSAPLVVTINSGVYISSNATGTPALTVNGSFPNGVSLTNNGFIVGMGGNGGAGGGYERLSPYNSVLPTAGAAGGLALSVASAITINNAGTIAGGGGGGGGGGGNITFDKANSYGDGGGGGGGRSSAASNSTGGQGGFLRITGQNTYPSNNASAGTVSSAGGGGTATSSYTTAGNGASGGAWGSGGGTGAGASFTGTVTMNYQASGAGGGSAGAAVSGNSNITWTATGTRLGAIA